MIASPTVYLIIRYSAPNSKNAIVGAVFLFPERLFLRQIVVLFSTDDIFCTWLYKRAKRHYLAPGTCNCDWTPTYKKSVEVIDSVSVGFAIHKNFIDSVYFASIVLLYGSVINWTMELKFVFKLPTLAHSDIYQTLFCMLKWIIIWV